MAHHKLILRDPESASVFVCELIYGIIYVRELGQMQNLSFASLCMCFLV